jgi:CelD/BcsL family acetyltransferase involved in cellulose biosynthesis
MRTACSQVSFDLARDRWDALFAATPRQQFFHRFLLLEAAMTTVLSADRDRTVVLDADGRAMLPLRLIARTVDGLPGVRVLEYPHHVLLDLHDALLRPGDLEGARELLRGLDLVAPRGWDLLWLPRVPASSAFLQALRRLEPKGLVVREITESKSLSLAGGYDGVRQRIRSKFLVNERRKMKRLGEMGKVAHKVHRPTRRDDPAFLEFLRVEGSGWKGRGGSMISGSAGFRAFFETLVESFGAAGDCRIDHLELDGKSVAAQFALLSGGAINLLKIGYDEAYHQVGPGGLLLHETLKTAGELRELSFITGARWNDTWGARAEGVFDVRIHNSTPIGRLAHATARMKPHLKRGLAWVKEQRAGTAAPAVEAGAEKADAETAPKSEP